VSKHFTFRFFETTQPTEFLDPNDPNDSFSILVSKTLGLIFYRWVSSKK
jgi:hypothetical protein